MKRYQYEVRTFSVEEPEDVARILNNLGRVGWQVCSRLNPPDPKTYVFLLMKEMQ